MNMILPHCIFASELFSSVNLLCIIYKLLCVGFQLNYTYPKFFKNMEKKPRYFYQNLKGGIPFITSKAFNLDSITYITFIGLYLLLGKKEKSPYSLTFCSQWWNRGDTWYSTTVSRYDNFIFVYLYPCDSVQTCISSHLDSASSFLKQTQVLDSQMAIYVIRQPSSLNGNFSCFDVPSLAA